MTHAATSPMKGMSAEPVYRWWRDPLQPQYDSWWGAGVSQTDLRQQVALLSEAGAALYRIDVPWPLVARTQPGGASYSSALARDPTWPGYQWQRLDDIVELLHTAGIQPVLVPVFTPTWAGGITDGQPTPNNPPTSGTYYADFVTALLKRYGSSVTYFELWNEPDRWATWNGTIDQYVQLVLRPGYEAVKATVPSAHVLVGGLAGADKLEDVYKAGGGGYFDIGSVHDYPPGPVVSDIAQTVDFARHIMRTNGDAAKPIWLTEFGLMTRQSIPASWSSYASEDEQAQLITDVYAQVHAQAIFLYQLADTDIVTDGATIGQGFWGIVTRDLSRKKPGFYAFQAAK